MLDYTEQLKGRGVLLASDSLRSGAVRTARRAGDRYICAAQELHQPLAFTSLPGKSWQGPWAEPLAP
jgi:hypothetical protein